ncbi:helix-turn-helix transcriptional regulator [Pedobacter nototheniae]|uniref:LexA family transcriptional regulator n=1 Tax=Pedobacter nototheniae TaxID=2488994 RepID=UPI002931A63C|nr:S24 family peptidase [Pedobacter nototheniae]
MTENQRLKSLIDILHFKTQKEFAEKIKIQQGSLSDILREKNGMGISNALKDKLRLILGVNIEWLETGIGEPINKESIISKPKEGVPYFDISLSDTDKLVLEEERAEYLVNYQPFNDCSAYLPVYGDSMYPKYAAGEIIAVKEITNYEILQWGEAYIVMTDAKTNNLRSIKLVYEHKNEKKIILRSSNPDYKGDIILNRDNIIALYIIKGKITRNSI